MSKFEDDIARGCLESGEPLDALYGVGWWTEMPEPEPDPVDLHIAELEARIAELEAKQRWIPVSERLPKDGDKVLIWAQNDWEAATFIRSGVYDLPVWETLRNFDYEFDTDTFDLVTHWMERPLPPEDTNNEPA